jgi:hypothetical protein
VTGSCRSVRAFHFQSRKSTHDWYGENLGAAELLRRPFELNRAGFEPWVQLSRISDCPLPVLATARKEDRLKSVAAWKTNILMTMVGPAPKLKPGAKYPNTPMVRLESRRGFRPTVRLRFIVQSARREGDLLSEANYITFSLYVVNFNPLALIGFCSNPKMTIPPRFRWNVTENSQ